MCLAQGLQRSDAGEARTRGPSVSSQAPYHWATALPMSIFCQCKLQIGDNVDAYIIGRLCAHYAYNILAYNPLQYYSANENWQSRDILFTIAEYIV